MNRHRHAARVAGVNARFRPRRWKFDHIQVFPASPDPLDRLRYGECGGFGAPQARRAREQMGFRR